MYPNSLIVQKIARNAVIANTVMISIQIAS